MATLINFTKLARDTIADGDALNKNITAAVANDDAMLAEANSTHDTVASVYSTVNSNSAKWDNAKILGFNTTYIQTDAGTSVADRGAGAFAKTFNFFNKDGNAISAYIENSVLKFAENAGDLEQRRNRSYLHFNKDLIDNKSKFDDASIILNTQRQNGEFNHKLQASATNSLMMLTDKIKGMLSASNSAVIIDTYCANQEDGRARIVDNSYMITMLEPGWFSSPYPADMSIAIDNYKAPIYVSMSSISLKGGSTVQNQSIAFAELCGSGSNDNLYVSDKSISVFTTAVSPVTAKNCSQMYFVGTAVNPSIADVETSSIMMNMAAYAASGCSILIGSNSPKNGTKYYVTNSAIDVSNFNTNTGDIRSKVHNQSIAVMPPYTITDTTIVPDFNALGKTIALQSFIGRDDHKSIFVKGGSVYNSYDHGLSAVIKNDPHGKNALFDKSENSILLNARNAYNNTNLAGYVKNSILSNYSFAGTNGSRINDSIMSNSNLEICTRTFESDIFVNTTIHSLTLNNSLCVGSTFYAGGEQGHTMSGNIALNSNISYDFSHKINDTIYYNSVVSNNAEYSNTMLIKSVLHGNVNGKIFGSDMFINSSAHSVGQDVCASGVLAINSFVPDRNVHSLIFNMSTAWSADYLTLNAKTCSVILLNSDVTYSRYNDYDVSISMCNSGVNQSTWGNSKDAQQFYFSNLKKSIVGVERQRFVAWNGAFTLDNEQYLNYIKFDTEDYTVVDNVAAVHFVGISDRLNNYDANADAFRKVTFTVL